MTITKSTKIGTTKILQAPPITYCDGCDSFVLALISAGICLNRPITYARLKGLSALAFRLLFHQEWRRYSPDALVGFDHLSLAFNSLGFHPRLIEIDPRQHESIVSSRSQIIQSVDVGLPVLGLHLGNWEDWGVIIGYEDHGQTLICRTPHDPKPDIPTSNKHWPVYAVFIDHIDDAPDQRKCILTSLRTALTLYTTSRIGDYLCGRNAYRFWISGLRDESFYASFSEPEGGAYASWSMKIQEAESENARMDRRYANAYLERVHVNAWRLKSLIDARKSAAVYCYEIADLFPNPQTNYLHEAASCYSDLQDLMETAIPIAPWESDLMLKGWSQKQRDQQADLLERALIMEECALGFIAKVMDDQVSVD